MGEVREFKAGWSIVRQSEEFEMDRRTVARRIRDAWIPPAGVRNGYDVYQLARVAPAILGFTRGEVATVDPRDLPPTERRAYFQSENERLEAEKTMARLVPAAEMEADYADLVGTMVQFLNDLPQVLARDCELGPAQLDRIQQACDEAREALQSRLDEREALTVGEIGDDLEEP